MTHPVGTVARNVLDGSVFATRCDEVGWHRPNGSIWLKAGIEELVESGFLTLEVPKPEPPLLVECRYLAVVRAIAAKAGTYPFNDKEELAVYRLADEVSRIVATSADAILEDFPVQKGDTVVVLRQGGKG